MNLYALPTWDLIPLLLTTGALLLVTEVFSPRLGSFRWPLTLLGAGVLGALLPTWPLDPGVQGLVNQGLWFILGLNLAEDLPKKRLAATVSFSLLDSVLTLGLVLGGSLLGGISWPLALVLGVMAMLRSQVSLSDNQKEALGANRLVQIVTSSSALSRVLGAAVLVTLGLIDRNVPWYTYILSLGYIGALGLLFPLLLRPLLQRFSEESPGMTYLLLLLGLGAGLGGAMLFGWPSWGGLFLAGILAGRLLPTISVLRNRLKSFSWAFLFPLLLVFAGLQLDFTTFLDPHTWIVGGGLLLIAVVTPFVVSGVLRIWYAYGTWETNLAAALSVAYSPSAFLAVFASGAVIPAALGPGLILLAGSAFLGPMLTRNFLKTQDLRKLTPEDTAEISGRRIMVSLANPDTAGHLVDLALALHTKDNPEPLFPVIVVQEGPEADKAVLHAERMLTSAMSRAVSLGKNVVPVTSLDMNITSGISRVSRARRISLLILGWNGQFGVQRSIFGSVLDQTVKSSTLELFVLKASGALVGVPRLLVGFPPLVERQPGFEQGLIDLTNLGTSLGCRYVFSCLKDTQVRVEEILHRWKIPGDRSFEVLDDWKTLVDRWKTQASPRDMMVLFSLRQNQLAWQPSLDRLPRTISQTFPAQPFLVIYPGSPQENRSDEDTSNSLLQATAEDLPKVILNMGHLSLEEALTQLLKIDFYGETLDKTSVILSETAQNQPVELKPGVLLVHTHLNIVDDFSVYWGVNPQGWDHPGLSQKVKVVVALLSPLAEGPEMHLKKLAELARLIGKTDWVERLLKAKNREELVGKLPDYKP